MSDLSNPLNDFTELGDLLASTIGSVVQAQERLDQYTLDRARQYQAASVGDFALPPLWYLFRSVAIELELSARVSEVQVAKGGAPQPHLVCKTLTPGAVSLYGREAAAGMRVKVQIEPQGYAPVKLEEGKDNHGGDNG